MKRNAYTTIGVISSMFWPLSVAALIAARVYFGDYLRVETFVREHRVYDFIFVSCCVLSFLVAPIFLVLGVSRSPKELSKLVMPFAIGLGGKAVGFTFLMIYLSRVFPIPFILIIFYSAIYGAALMVRLRKPNQALEPTPMSVTPPAAQEPRRP